MNITDQMIETAAKVLSSEGADTEHGWHGWRCFDQDRYPEPCSCTEVVARAVLEAVAPLIRADEARTIAKSCDELARMAPSSVGMVADLLHSRADKLEREAGRGNHR